MVADRLTPPPAIIRLRGGSAAAAGDFVLESSSFPPTPAEDVLSVLVTALAVFGLLAATATVEESVAGSSDLIVNSSKLYSK